MDAGRSGLNAPRLTVREIIVVEGRYDKNALSQVVDGVILTTDGFGIFNNPGLRKLLKKLCAERGVVILTDSDSAGFLIRNHIKGFLPPDTVKHAYIPARPGKERRKTAPGAEGLLGVEGMTPEVLREALRRAGVETETSEPGHTPVTKADLYAWGLSGREDSARKRAALCEKLDLPAHLSSAALCGVLTALYAREDVLCLLEG